MRLIYSNNSPFTRAILTLLDELGLPHEDIDMASEQGRALLPPTKQAPCLIDGDRKLWETMLIAEYLLRHHGEAAPAGLSRQIIRSDREWDDRLMLAALLTFGTSIAVVAQMASSGVPHAENSFLSRNVERLDDLLDMFEQAVEGGGRGFLGAEVSVQDILLCSLLDFIDNRPLGLNWRSGDHPNIAALLAAVKARDTFARHAPGPYTPNF